MCSSTICLGNQASALVKGIVSKQDFFAASKNQRHVNFTFFLSNAPQHLYK